MRSSDASWPTKHHRQQQSGHRGPELESDGTHAVHGVCREPGHYGFRERRASTSARVRHRLTQYSEIHLTFLSGSRLVESTQNVVTKLHVFPPPGRAEGRGRAAAPYGARPVRPWNLTAPTALAANQKP